MSTFEFPKNIKQIGSIGEGIKIYIEDYVCTYLSQYAEAGGYDERLAFLVGRSMVIDGQAVLFISGCVQSMYCVYEKGIVSFTEKTWESAKIQINKYFKDMQIVGWMQSQPGYGSHLNSNYANYHINNFIQDDHVMFVCDPIEKVNVFYVWNDERTDIIETRGYFVYYDKNRYMHEYMLDNKINKINMKEPESAVADNPGEVERERVGFSIYKPGSAREKSGGRSSAAEDTAENIMRQRQAVRSTKHANVEQKKVVNMLVSLSAVLVLICFIMGAGLIQNDGRVNTLEKQLTQLNTAYRDLLVQIRDGKSESVFATLTDNNEAMTSDSADDSQSAKLITENGNELLAASIPTPSAVPTVAPTVEPTQEQQQTEAPQAETPVTPAVAVQKGYNPDTIPDTYTIQQGDNLSSISLRFYGDKSMVNKIMEVNGISDPDKLFFGKVIKLPK